MCQIVTSRWDIVRARSSSACRWIRPYEWVHYAAMSKRNRRANSGQIVPFREGEGSLVPVQMQLIERPGLPTVTQFGLNLSTAPVPNRKYVADIFDVHVDRGMAYLLFGQRKLDGNKLRSLIVVHFSERSV